MKLDYIDIHSHLNLSPLTENQEAILAKMKECGVGTITVGTGLETSQRAVTIAENNPERCWATAGFHPCDCAVPPLVRGGAEGGGVLDSWDKNFLELEVLAQHPKTVAIGETGLDYFHENTVESRTIQTTIFKKHIALAVKVNKPLMLHVRSSKGSDDAYYDALTTLKEENYSGKANFHFFSGSRSCMESIIAAGYAVSVDGPITFVAEYDEMIKAVPLDKIMIETDAPFAAPKPYRGKPCEPWMVTEIAKRIAELKGLDEELVRKQLLINTQDFFGIQ